MAEANSIQMAKVLASPPVKLQPNERNGRSRIMFAQIVWISGQIGDTVYLGRIPAGARITGCWLNTAAGTASSTLAIGLRKASDKTVIDATGLAAATSIASAQKTDTISTGTLTKNGLSYVTQQEVDVYGTLAGAVTPVSPGQAIAVTVDYVSD
ncbi:hypothetical protein SAMN04487926_12154 [Paraburkholderia steynii]|uniref:Uncharacterized protein n=1 Tax=Paraburkholderia steynii TaxID=1245441 RepID=A0A7Z7BBZ3_9BURK|nr:hypothetical protein [Paraburkholderia steynii]SDI65280.1 hypothetical protein SAMN04487926_12154 [Paraburkholderia steynii]